MDIPYLLAAWIHIFMVAIWIGAMFFEDPESNRFFSRLVNKMNGIGWYAQAVLWVTGLYMLKHHGFDFGQMLTLEFLATGRGQLIWAKLLLVITLMVFQATVGHKASKLIYGYVVITWAIVGISVVLARIKLGVV